MDVVSEELLQELLRYRSSWCVTIYLPTHVGHHENRDDAIQLRNAADGVTEELIAHGMRAVEARELISRIRQIPLDEPYWAERGEGLAIFLSPDWFRLLRLAQPVPQYTMVNRRFHLRPLVPIIADNHRFLILAISQKAATLYRANRDEIEEVVLPQLKLDRQLVLDLDMGERGGQTHSGGRFGSLKQDAITTGHGGTKDTNKGELLSYLRRIHEEVSDTLQRQQLPLVLATVDYLAPLYREVCDYPHLLESFVTGCPDHLPPLDLHARAWHQVLPHFAAIRDQSLRRFHQLARTGRALDQVSEVMPSIVEGRVDSLLIDEAGECWGQYSVDQAQLVMHESRQPGDDDLIDWAASETLRRRGAVYSLPHQRMPTTSPLAAIMRY